MNLKGGIITSTRILIGIVLVLILDAFYIGLFSTEIDKEII